MAITRIHKITKTFEKAIDYCRDDKKEDHVKDDIADVINYATNDKVGETVYYTLNASQNCLGEEKESFRETIEKGRGKFYSGESKTKSGEEVLAWHLVQSFDTVIDPRVANEIGRKLAEEVFGNFPVTISTHTNTENTHNHLIICAWDLDGKKWNNCNENYRLIRETSDRLCDEYGLNVLEETRNQKLIRFKDEEGNTRYFEPTDRKIDIIKQRELGQVSPDDINSYRNTIPYEDVVNKDLTNKEIIKNDIDNLLNVVNDYEQLLKMLRDAGYIIKDKKKNGDWLKYVSFKNPMADKFTRDRSLSEDGFYLRENLTEHINDLVQIRKEKLQEFIAEKYDYAEDIPYFETYGLETNPHEINEDYRKLKDDDGNFYVINRTLPEKDIIRDLKKTQQEAGVYDTSTIERLLEAQRLAKQKKKKYVPVNRKQELLIKIQEGYKNLKFIEEKNIYSFEQINQTVASLYIQQDRCQEMIVKLDSLIKHLESVANTPQKMQDTLKIMQEKANDPVYLEFEYETDKNLINTYQNIISKYKIDTPEGLKSLNEKINSALIQIDKLKNTFNATSDELDRYNRCIRVLERAERLREQERVQEKVKTHDHSRDHIRDNKERQKDKNKDERERI